ncbi:hypothetical protein GW17_00040294 [Ensete ventricosum]|nr:hypothetical protein GW17_00040294 [Ensete ventricosum]
MGGVWNFLIILRLEVEVAVAVVVAVGEVEVVGTRTVTSVVNLAILPESANCGLAQGDWEVEGVEALAHLAIDEVLAMVVEVAVHEGEDPPVAAIHLGVGHQHVVVMILRMVTGMWSELCDPSHIVEIRASMVLIVFMNMLLLIIISYLSEVLAGIDAEAILLAVTRATAVHQHIVVKTPPPMPMGV